MDSVPDCQQRETLVSYLYGECEPAERQRLEAHLTTCQSCADELASFGAVRQTLEAWTPPEPALGFRIVAETDREPAPRSWWQTTLQPAWSLALAVALIMVVAAAVASVEVRFGDGAFVFRMGWSNPAPDGADPAARATVSAGGAVPSPWRADLAALEDTLRRDLTPAAAVEAASRPVGAVGPATGVATDELLREIQSIIEQRERRQQQEFASGLITLAQEFDLQRREDQLRVQQDVGSLADYLVRISGR